MSLSFFPFLSREIRPQEKIEFLELSQIHFITSDVSARSSLVLETYQHSGLVSQRSGRRNWVDRFICRDHASALSINEHFWIYLYFDNEALNEAHTFDQELLQRFPDPTEIVTIGS